MIDLPKMPMTAEAAIMDFGLIQRGALGGSTDRIDRKGSRFRISVTAGPFYATVARELVADLIAGLSEGVRIAYPLQWSQGNPGAMVVDGANQQGTSLNIKNATPGYVARKGYFFSLADATGRHHLHSVKQTTRVASDGRAVLTILPPLRIPAMADNTVVHMAKPMVQGLTEGNEWSWQLSADQVTPIIFGIEEQS